MKKFIYISLIYATIFLAVVLEWSFVSIITFFIVLIFIYPVFPYLYLKVVKDYREDIVFLRILGLAISLSLLWFGIKMYVDKISTLKDSMIFIVFYTPLLIYYMVIMPDRDRLNDYMFIISSVIIGLGYYFYYVIPNDLVRITEVGIYLFSDVYLFLLSFLYLTIFLVIVFSIFFPIYIIFRVFINTFEGNRKYSGVGSILGLFTVSELFIIGSMLFSLIISLKILDISANKIETEDFLRNSFVDLFYTSNLPSRCIDKSIYFPEDKFMLIDINNISVAYKTDDSYEMDIGTCNEKIIP